MAFSRVVHSNYNYTRNFKVCQLFFLRKMANCQSFPNTRSHFSTNSDVMSSNFYRDAERAYPMSREMQGSSLCLNRGFTRMTQINADFGCPLHSTFSVPAINFFVGVGLVPTLCSWSQTRRAPTRGAFRLTAPYQRCRTARHPKSASLRALRDNP